MRIGMLQPGYLPWLGLFEQVYNVEKFVLFDDTQYTKQDWRSRNRIKTANGVLWLTVPTHGRQNDLIRDVRICDNNGWRERHCETLRHAYGKAPYFDWLMPDLEAVVTNGFEYLVELDIELIYVLLEKLGITTPIIVSSNLGIHEPDREMKIIRTVQRLNGDRFYEGKSGKEILSAELFKQHRIGLEFQNYEHSVYPQLWDDFVPFLSVVDLLFNCGPESLDYIIGKKGVEQ